MNSLRFLPGFFLLLSALALGPLTRAQETPPPAAPASAAPEAAKADEPADGKKNPEPAASPDTPAAPAAPVEPAAPAEPTANPAPAVEVSVAVESDAKEPAKPAAKDRKLREIKIGGVAVDVNGRRRHSGNDRVRVLDDNYVAADVTVSGDAVAVLGDLTIDGEVTHDAVAILGDSVINGTVRHNAVTVLGDVTLGPKARVEGDLVIVGGEVHRDPGAFVGGDVHLKPINGNFDRFNSWWGRTLKLGRPLAIGAHLGWLWIVTGFSVAFYALLALLFPRSIRNCGDKLVLQPGLTIMAAVLGILALPVLFLLLCITVIGIPVAVLLLPVACILAVLYGKAAIYTLVGLKLSNDRLHPAVAALVGTMIFIVIYLVPVVGLLISLLVALTGFGCVILTVFGPSKKAPSRNAPAAVPPLAPAFAPASAGGAESAGLPPGEAAPPVAFVATLPPVISAATLPRAGFWIRVAAALLDTVLIGILIGMFEAFFHAFGFHPGEAFPFWVVLYSVIMWATKATTIGGIICGLRIVRLDDSPVDWGVAIVRALGGFLSLAVVGLGFIWVAFDDEKQSWHDKIAGTTVVRVPKGTPLV